MPSRISDSCSEPGTASRWPLRSSVQRLKFAQSLRGTPSNALMTLSDVGTESASTTSTGLLRLNGLHGTHNKATHELLHTPYRSGGEGRADQMAVVRVVGWVYAKRHRGPGDTAMLHLVWIAGIRNEG